jgi:hypothetical protein
MYIRYYSRDYFSKCAKEAKYFIYVGEHEGTKHQYAVEGYSKKLEPCKHYVAKCVNYKGLHPATSRRCLER